MRIIYTGGFIPDLGIEDSQDSRFWGWLMAKNYDGQWVSIANLSLQITKAVMECEPTTREALESRVRELEAERDRLKAVLLDISDFDCVNARHDVKCDGYCPPCMASAAVAACFEATGVERDAARYRVLRRKICIIEEGRHAEFRIINLRPVYIAPRPDIELDAALDAALKG